MEGSKDLAKAGPGSLEGGSEPGSQHQAQDVVKVRAGCREDQLCCGWGVTQGLLGSDLGSCAQGQVDGESTSECGGCGTEYTGLWDGYSHTSSILCLVAGTHYRYGASAQVKVNPEGVVVHVGRLG